MIDPAHNSATLIVRHIKSLSNKLTSIVNILYRISILKASECDLG